MLREVRNTSHKPTRRKCLEFDFELQFICTCLIIDMNDLQGCRKFFSTRRSRFKVGGMLERF